MNFIHLTLFLGVIFCEEEDLNKDIEISFIKI